MIEKKEHFRAEKKAQLVASASAQRDADRALEMLHYWWPQAGEAQQREFLCSVE